MMKLRARALWSIAVSSLAVGLVISPAIADTPDAAVKAKAVVAKMTPDEKVVLTNGIMPLPFVAGTVIPADAVVGAGYVPGVPRLGIPALKETDASLGVAWVGGLRHDGATAMPSGIAQAASWNPDLLYRGGAMIGSEARAKGFNVMLAGGANLTRDPRNGRTFEYLSEDPLLTGTLVGAAINGIQSNHIISTIKHFALNGQETARKFVDVRISEAAARESDLLAFQIGIEKGHPGSVMCSYNVINGQHGCDNDWTLNTVLRKDWRWDGFVMSDWGAVTGMQTAMHGLDQQSGYQLDPALFLGKMLGDAAAKDAAVAKHLDEMNIRVLTAIYANGVDTHPAKPGGAIDFKANGEVALEAAKQGIVLLKNDGGTLPLAASAKRIVVIGGLASRGVMSGAGSSQVQGVDGPAASFPVGNDGPFSALMSRAYHRSPPLKAIEAMAPSANVTYRDGYEISDAVAQAKKADVVIVFATKWSTEGEDAADFTLPEGQDALISAVAEANPHTIVVLETGNPVTMPWLDKVPAVMEAWYPGARGGEAIASVLFGQTNPSGHLPITFPAGAEQLPRRAIDGFATLEPDFSGGPPTPDTKVSANYDIEGSDVGYRWFARTQAKPLFPFGYGLSYTSFAASDLTVTGLHASLTVANTGAKAGATVAQVYLVSRNGAAKQRLVGFQRVDLAAGVSQKLSLTIDPRLLADWKNGGWSLAGGDYAFALGEDAGHLGAPVTAHFDARNWKD